MAKIPRRILEWRAKQKPGAIMKSETFEKIKEKAKKYGAREPEAVAGAAYYKTLKAKAIKALRKKIKKRKKKRGGD